MKMYGIEYKGELLGLYPTSNDGQMFCNQVSVTFEPYEPVPWLHPNKEHVENLINTPIAWYNSSIESPEFPEHFRDEAFIVEVNLEIQNG